MGEEREGPRFIAGDRARLTDEVWDREWLRPRPRSRTVTVAAAWRESVLVDEDHDGKAITAMWSWDSLEAVAPE